MLNQRVKVILDRIIANHPRDVVETITLGERESSMIAAKNVPPFILRFNNCIKPQYLDQYTALGGTDGVLQQLADVIQKKLATEQFAQDRRTYQTALDALQNSNTSPSWSSYLHAGPTYSIHDIRIRDLLAFYWLTASDPQMNFIDSEAQDAENDAEKRAALVKSSIENFIGLVAECRTAHNESSDAPNALHAPSCLSGTFGRIVLRSSVFNKITEVTGALFASIVPAIENFIADLFMATTNQQKTITFRFISEKLIVGTTSSQEENDFYALLAQLKSQAHLPMRLLTTLTEGIPGLATEAAEVQTDLMNLFILQLDMLRLDNDLPQRNYIDRIRKITFTPIAAEKYDSLTKQDEEIIKIRLEIFGLSLKLNALEFLIDDEVMKVFLIPRHLHRSRTKTIWEGLVILANNYAKQFDAASTKLDALLKARDILFENTNLDAEGMYEKPPIEIQQELRNRTSIVNVSLLNIVHKLEKLFSDSRDQAMHHGYNRFREAFPNIVCYSKRTISEEWALNFLHIIYSIYPKYSIEQAIESVDKWIIAMMDTLEPEEINACIQAINNYTNHLHGSPKMRLAVIQALISAFKRHELTLNNLYETISFSDFANYFNHLFSNIGKLATWHQLTELPLILFDELDMCKEQGINAAKWKSGIHLILKEGKKITSVIDALINAYILMTVFKNLQLTEIKKSDADTLVWISQHYLDPLSKSRFKSCTFTRDLEGLTTHLAHLLTTLKPLADLFNVGFIRIMSAEAARPILNEYSQYNKYSNPIIFRISNSFPYRIAVSSKDKDVLTTCAESMRKCHSLLKEITMDGPPFAIQLVTLDFLKTFINVNQRTPILSLRSFTDTVSNEYRSERICEYTDAVIGAVAPRDKYKMGAINQVATQGNVISQLKQVVYSENRHNESTFFQPEPQANGVAESATSSSAEIVYGQLPEFSLQIDKGPQ